MRGGGGRQSDRYADSRPEQRRSDTHMDLYDDVLLDSRASSRSESRFHKEDGGKNQRQSTSTLIPGLGIDANIDDEDAFLYGDEAPSAGRSSSSTQQKSFEEKPFMEDVPRKKAEESWMAAPSQRFGGGPPSPDASDLTIDLNLPFDRRKSGEPSRQGKLFQDTKSQLPEGPQRSSRRMPERERPDRMMDEPDFDSWKPSQRRRSPSPEQSPPPSARPSKMAPSKHSMLGYNSIESMKQELRELKMMLSKEKEAKEESYERSKRMRSPSDDGSYSRGGRSPSPVKRRRESYSPVHRRRGRSPIDSYRRPSPPPSYRRERRESPYYRGAATPSMRRYSPSPTNSLSPSSDRSGGKRWSPSPPPRHISRRQEGRTPARTPGRRWSPDSPPPRPRRSSLERTPKHPSSQASYYQESSRNAPQPGYYDGGQPPGPPVNLPNLSVPPPNFPMNAPPPQAPPYFAGYPAQAPPDFSYPPPSTQPQQLRSNLRVDEPASSYPSGVKQEETPVATPPLSKSQQNQQPTQEEIEHYLRLVENKDSLRDKVNLLKQELVRLGKIQNEVMRRRQHERDGHRDPLLLESSSMYEDVKKQLMEVNSSMENVSRNIFKVNQKVKLEAINYKKKMEEEALAAESPDTAGIKFVYEDPRDHWCQTCNTVLPSMNDMFRHLHSPKHKEFLVGISGYYCKLCKVMSGDSAMARNHLHSLEHNQNYTATPTANRMVQKKTQHFSNFSPPREVHPAEPILRAALEDGEGPGHRRRHQRRRRRRSGRRRKRRSRTRRKTRTRRRTSPTGGTTTGRTGQSLAPRLLRRTTAPPPLPSGPSRAGRKTQEKIRRKNEELLKEERENSRSVKELDDSEVSPKKILKASSPTALQVYFERKRHQTQAPQEPEAPEAATKADSRRDHRQGAVLPAVVPLRQEQDGRRDVGQHAPEAGRRQAVRPRAAAGPGYGFGCGPRGGSQEE
ncbi:hypothetical protein HPB48_008803 [Haemaphysalis longicornis]|uniref:U1-type domain-containing protein n=1 Tax=Haemaphysalis longicornis TaxID=44386 RepID=A0A9J6H0F0_HAELO|nr:hypothetical protein HPB48_008803 [Haemaphysalis longicornis]